MFKLSKISRTLMACGYRTSSICWICLAQSFEVRCAALSANMSETVTPLEFNVEEGWERVG